MLSVRSNAHYTQEENASEFALNPMLEVIIIFTDGKDYAISKKQLVSTVKLSEIRMIVSPEMLQSLITDLQLHQKKLDGIRKNADQLSSLVKYVTEKDEKPIEFETEKNTNK